MTTTIQIDLESGAERSFIGYLSGNVAELVLTRDGVTESIVAMVEGGTDDDCCGLALRRFDDVRGRPAGDRFVINLEDLQRVTIY